MSSITTKQPWTRCEAIPLQPFYLDLDDFRFRGYVAAALEAVKFLRLFG